MTGPVVRLTLHAALRRFPGWDGPEREVRLAAGEPLSALLGRLGVPASEVLGLVVDGVPVRPDHVPRDGARVEVLPALCGG